jgi:hypothetical protein
MDSESETAAVWLAPQMMSCLTEELKLSGSGVQVSCRQEHHPLDLQYSFEPSNPIKKTSAWSFRLSFPEEGRASVSRRP